MTSSLDENFLHWDRHMEIAGGGGEVWTEWRVIHHQFSFLDVDGLPDLSSSHTEVLPFLK
jgi:hypothetical protein